MPEKGYSQTDSAQVREQASHVASDLERHTSEIDDWVKSEDAIMVPCRLYSTAALTLALVIILGTISVPFLVQERMKGVDPFQWVTFAWLVAGAILVGAKSRYDETWPWHDFVRGQIFCQGVKQLSKVSAVDAQTILLYLLHNEMKNPLAFRGPYKKIFSKQAASAGFSIDEPVDYSTIVAAGFLVWKVAIKDTEYLLFDDIRDDSVHDAETRLVCELPPARQKSKSLRGRFRDLDILKLQREKKDKFRNLPILGQYARDDRFG
jgi:hypothetical protein